MRTDCALPLGSLTTLIATGTLVGLPALDTGIQQP